MRMAKRVNSRRGASSGMGFFLRSLRFTARARPRRSAPDSIAGKAGARNVPKSTFGADTRKAAIVYGVGPFLPPSSGDVCKTLRCRCEEPCRQLVRGWRICRRKRHGSWTFVAGTSRSARPWRRPSAQVIVCSAVGGWGRGLLLQREVFLTRLGCSRMAVRAGPPLESRHDSALPVDSRVKGMSSNVKTTLPVRTHPRCATLGWSHDMLVPGPDIQPTDREFILTTLHAAFPNTRVTVHPRPASIATLFRVHDGAVLRHQLLVPRRVLDDARVKRTPLTLKRTPLARMSARAMAEMGQRGCDVVILGGESGRVV